MPIEMPIRSSEIPDSQAALLFAGCYTNETPTGIRVYDAADPEGALVELSAFEGVEHPSFLAAHPNGRVLYAVSETADFDGSPGGGIVALGIDGADGSLRLLDRVSSQGDAPCHLSVDSQGRRCYAANYASGSVVAYALAADGRFGKMLEHRRLRGSGPSPRQEGPHAHCIVPGPDAASVYAVDLGADRVVRFEHPSRPASGDERTGNNRTGNNRTGDGRPGDGCGLVEREHLVLASGSGPRQLAFHPEAPVAFVVCELDSTLVVADLDPASGQLVPRAALSTLPEGSEGDSLAAEVRLHPRGDRVYVSNRGHDSIAVFGFSAADRSAVALGHVSSAGSTPRSFAIHPSGRALFVANQDSHNMAVLAIDPQTAMPMTPPKAVHHVSEPACLTLLAAPR